MSYDAEPDRISSPPTDTRAAELELKSRELKIAMLGLIATVLLGLGGTVGTYLAGSANQKANSRDERIASDRAELRSVLDRALADLTAMESTVEDYIFSRETGHLADPPDPEWTASFDAVHLSEARLSVRLGSDADAGLAYGRAVNRLSDTRRFATSTRPGRVSERVGAALQRGLHEMAAFTQEANELVGSKFE